MPSASNPERWVHIDHLSMVYERGRKTNEVLRNVSFSVPKGKFVSIVGPSGGGKTTLFNILAGLLEPTGGRVTVAGRPVGETKRQVGYMLQKDLLLPWRTVLENVTIGLEIMGLDRKEREKRAIPKLQQYGLGDFMHVYPHEISGGMKQRAALVRTLILDPSIILLDEPFSALDYQTRLLLEEDLLVICRQEMRTMLLVTHDIGEAISLSDMVVVLSHRPAKVKQIHQINLSLDGPRTPLAARRAPEYHHYFEMIWNELELHGEVGA